MTIINISSIGTSFGDTIYPVLPRRATARFIRFSREGRLNERYISACTGLFFSGASLSCGISGTLRSGSTTGTGGIISGSCLLGSLFITPFFLGYLSYGNPATEQTFLENYQLPPSDQTTKKPRRVGGALATLSVKVCDDA
jgi:hypothetical protein